MNDWLRLVLASPLAAAVVTVLIGALFTNYPVNVFKSKSAAAERKLQRQTDLAARQIFAARRFFAFGNLS